MDRNVTLIRITDDDPDMFDTGEYAARIQRVVESCGGVSEGLWALIDGPYQFVAVSLFPERAAAIQARTEIEALGALTVEGYPIADMQESLQVMAA